MSQMPYDETGPQQAFDPNTHDGPPLPPQQPAQVVPREPQHAPPSDSYRVEPAYVQQQQAVVFDVDRVQAEKRSQRERAIPFTTRIAGRVITFTNPKGLDWQDLLYLGDDPAEFVELCIADDDQRAHVMAAGIDADVMEDLIEAFTRHYGIGDRSRGGRGNRRASRP